MDFVTKPVSALEVFLMFSNKKLCLSKGYLSEMETVQNLGAINSASVPQSPPAVPGTTKFPPL